ncbi:MAG TPA: PPC domain-containing protein [Tepidisphaeraceae bacterium]|nr:PPC domain-containing protein [Tepidisphaeraceae bacterium]
MPLLLALIVSAFAPRVRAQAVPVITGVPQALIQRGQSIDLTLSGQHLATVNSLAVSQARGLAVTLVEPAKDARPGAGEIRLHLSADIDAVLGEREIRLISPTGVSAPLRVTVGQYPQLLEKEPNNTPELAQQVTFPITLIGKIDVPGDVDCFRFNARKGEKIVFDVHAVRARSQLDALLTIHNESGHELATHIDTHGGDPTVIFDCPADGPYLLSIRDLQYRGGADFTYSVDAGAIPYVQSLLPMTAQPGKLAEIKPLGVNLTGAETIPLDLTYASEGEISVRARASAGISNAVKMDVTELPAFADDQPAHDVEGARVVAMPVAISGRIDAAGDENFFKFHVSRKQIVTLEATAKRLGSPMDPLLVLRNAKGAAMQTADDVTGAGAFITRDLEPGDYAVSVRDLFFHGGPTYAFGLSIRSGPGAGGAGVQDFSARFLPDALRVSRGGNAIVFVDLQRKGEFKGDITVTLEDLPPGVTCPPLIVNETLPGASGMLVVSAAPVAAIGSFPLRLRASATIGTTLVSHLAAPVQEGRPVDQAYITVMDGAPFTIEPVATLSPARLGQLSAEADTLAAKLAAANPQIEAAQAEWEKKVSPIVWQTLDKATIASVSGTQFSTLPDSSFLAANPSPERDTYTVIAPTDLTGITAIRLEALADDSLPGKGPGRHSSGNFVLSHFTVAVAPADAPTTVKPVVLQKPIADFEQAGFPVIDAIEPKVGKGWGSSPRTGKNNEAIFFTDQPIGRAKGSLLTFTLDCQFGQQQTLGRFRISVTTDPQAAAKSIVPPRIMNLLAIWTDKRTPEQKTQIATFYRTIDPEVSEESARLTAIRSLVGVHAEMARLEAALAVDSPELNAQRMTWEKSIAEGSTWRPLEFSALKSEGGATLKQAPDGSIMASGKSPANDVYALIGTTPIKNITAIRIEAIPDPTLPRDGPGRAADGNFVLSKLIVFASQKNSEEVAPPIDFKSASATFEQQKFSAAKALTGENDNGWAILPNTGKPAIATFVAKEPIGPQGGTELRIFLEHHFSSPRHTLGHFRIWATNNPSPDSALTLEPEISSILKTDGAKRTAKQKTALSAYYRGIAPSLDPVRHLLAELKERSEAELTIARGKKFAAPFLLNRAGFNGDIRISLDGFIAGRDPNTGAPTPLAAALKADPLVVPAGKASGTLNVEVERASGFGSRYVVLRAEAKVGDDVRVEYSAPFVLTVLEK